MERQQKEEGGSVVKAPFEGRGGGGGGGACENPVGLSPCVTCRVLGAIFIGCIDVSQEKREGRFWDEAGAVYLPSGSNYNSSQNI